LVVDWSDPLYSQNGVNVFHRFFRCPSHSQSDDIPLTDSVYPAIWRGNLHEQAHQIAARYRYDPDQMRRLLSTDFGRLDYDEQVLVLFGFSSELEKLRPHFQEHLPEFFEVPATLILRKLLQEELILQPEIRDRVEHFKRGHFSPRTVGVHVRFSDFRVSLLAIVRQLNQLLMHEPDLQVFLATDNIEIKKLFERHYSNLVTTPHWYANSGAAIHTSQASCDRTENAIQGLSDLYLLAECDYLIVDTTSSFSSVATILSQAQTDRIFVVRRGGKGSRHIRGLTTQLMRKTRVFTWGLRLVSTLVPIHRL
jgi:hypothetical protein